MNGISSIFKQMEYLCAYGKDGDWDRIFFSIHSLNMNIHNELKLNTCLCYLYSFVHNANCGASCGASCGVHSRAKPKFMIQKKNNALKIEHRVPEDEQNVYVQMQLKYCAYFNGDRRT